MTATVDRERSEQTYMPPTDQRELLRIRELRDVLDAKTFARGARLVSADGREVPVPAELVPMLLQVIDAMQSGLAVTVAPHHMTLSTQEAADMLRISRTTLVRLLEDGAIPYEKPSKHRRVRLDDLLEYRRRQRKVADEALADMVADAQRLGLHDLAPASVQAVVKTTRARRAAARRTAATRGKHS